MVVIHIIPRKLIFIIITPFLNIYLKVILKTQNYEKIVQLLRIVTIQVRYPYNSAATDKIRVISVTFR